MEKIPEFVVGQKIPVKVLDQIEQQVVIEVTDTPDGHEYTMYNMTTGEVTKMPEPDVIRRTADPAFLVIEFDGRSNSYAVEPFKDIRSAWMYVFSKVSEDLGIMWLTSEISFNGIQVEDNAIDLLQVILMKARSEELDSPVKCELYLGERCKDSYNVIGVMP